MSFLDDLTKTWPSLDWPSLASAYALCAKHIEQIAQEREQKQVDAAIDVWENEGGSGPAETFFETPKEQWGYMLLVNGNDRWNTMAWHPHADVINLLLACREASDPKIREMARELERRWWPA